MASSSGGPTDGHAVPATESTSAPSKPPNPGRDAPPEPSEPDPPPSFMRQTISPSYARWPLIAYFAVAGIVDAATLVGFSLVFSSNQTGNLLILGISLAGLAVPSLPALAPPIPHAVSIASFIAGSLLAGLALPPAPGPRTRGAFVVSDLAQAALLLCCAVAAIFGAPGNAVLAIASLCMGAQAAHARRSGVAELSATTVVTSVLSDLASDPGLLRGRNAARDNRILGVAGMFAGAFGGAALCGAAGAGWALLASAGGKAACATSWLLLPGENG
ncbi:hypothetical protein DFJ74DRAFT_703357 [Hyaloraphidium curvatum]|nr:hypothetical protein DFJ74DRAFT_703357 [Hyaloraphidium curvatum]